MSSIQEPIHAHTCMKPTSTPPLSNLQQKEPQKTKQNYIDIDNNNRITYVKKQKNIIRLSPTNRCFGEL